MCEVIFPSHTIHFHEVYLRKKKGGGISLRDREVQCLTEPRGKHFLRKAISVAPLPLPLSPFLPIHIWYILFFPVTDNPHLYSFLWQDCSANKYQVYCKVRNPTQTTMLRGIRKVGKK